MFQEKSLIKHVTWTVNRIWELETFLKVAQTVNIITFIIDKLALNFVEVLSKSY